MEAFAVNEAPVGGGIGEGPGRHRDLRQHHGARTKDRGARAGPRPAGEVAFGQLAPGQAPAARLVSSLVTTPMHAKAMLRALASAIESYEEQFGEVGITTPLLSDGARYRGWG